MTNITAIRQRFDDIMVQWQDVVDAKHAASGFTHPSDKVHYHLASKYARFDIGGSGAFMVELNTGTVYGIMGYGKVDKKKNSGNIYDQGFNGSVLVRDRFRYGRFTNNADGSIGFGEGIRKAVVQVLDKP